MVIIKRLKLIVATMYPPIVDCLNDEPFPRVKEGTFALESSLITRMRFNFEWTPTGLLQVLAIIELNIGYIDMT